MTTTAVPGQGRAMPRLGGFSATVVRLELRRMLRNRRTAIFVLVMPPAFFLLFGGGEGNRTERVGDGNVTGYVLLSMAVYGAMLATTSAGAMVSIERAAGWSRQLRLTPLRPIAYIAVKIVVAMAMGAASVGATFAVGAISGARLPGSAWIASGVLAWSCALVFAGLGLFMGYLLPSENVMQFLGPLLALLSFAGGLFVPLDQFSGVLPTLAKFTPVYGVGELARYPLTHEGSLVAATVNVLVWTVVFAAGAAWRFRRDTARV